MRWCASCAEKAARTTAGYCTLCGTPAAAGNSFHQCSRTDWLDIAYSWGMYRYPLNKAIQKLKYSRDMALGDTLSRLLYQVCRQEALHPDLVAPVPLSRERKRSRGYNQAALLARPLAWMLGAVYSNTMLHRMRDTASQVGLSIEQRKENMEAAFSAGKGDLTGKTVLLVDDVLTTGATLDAAAKAFKAAGAGKVIGLVVARA